MDLVLAGQLAERLVFFERLERHLKWERRAAALSCLPLDPSTCAVILLTNLYVARGLGFGLSVR
jgi:hypothetical protein